MAKVGRKTGVAAPLESEPTVPNSVVENARQVDLYANEAEQSPVGVPDEITLTQRIKSFVHAWGGWATVGAFILAGVYSVATVESSLSRAERDIQDGRQRIEALDAAGGSANTRLTLLEREKDHFQERFGRVENDFRVLSDSVQGLKERQAVLEDRASRSSGSP